MAGLTHDLVEIAAELEHPIHCRDLFPAADGKILVKSDSVGQTPAEVTLQRICTSERPHYLLWVRDAASLQIIRQTEIGRLATELRTDDAIVVLWLPTRWTFGEERRPLPVVQILEWRDRGLICRGWRCPDGLEPWRLGAFDYRALPSDGGQSMPYLRVRSPKTALLTRRLASHHAIDYVSLPDADFALDTLLQPLEHTELLVQRGRRWVDATGELHDASRVRRAYDSIDTRLFETRSAAWSDSANLVAGYIDGDPMSIAALDEHFARYERSPLSIQDARAARFDEVMLRLFTESERLLLEARFVEHLAETEHVRHPLLVSALSGVRERASGGVTEALLSAERSAFDAWQIERGRVGRLCWALWALASGWPLVAARTARAIAPEQLTFQIEAALDALSRRADAALAVC